MDKSVLLVGFEKTNLKEYRQKIGFTQAELGRFIGVDARTISAYELGTRKPSTKVAIRLAKTFKVKIEDIFPAFVWFELSTESSNKERRWG